MNIKFFVEKYITDQNMLISCMHNIKQYDIFEYFMKNIDDPSKLIEENFNNNLKGDLKIINWLITNGFKIRPEINFFDFSNEEFEIVLLIIQDAASNNDLKYLYDNTYAIINQVVNYDSPINRLHKKITRMFNIIPINILNTDLILEKATRYDFKNLIDMLNNDPNGSERLRDDSDNSDDLDENQD